MKYVLLRIEINLELQCQNDFNSILEITIAAWFVDVLYVSGIRRWCEKLTNLFRRMQKKFHKFQVDIMKSRLHQTKLSSSIHKTLN